MWENLAQLTKLFPELFILALKHTKLGGSFSYDLKHVELGGNFSIFSFKIKWDTCSLLIKDKCKLDSS